MVGCFCIKTSCWVRSLGYRNRSCRCQVGYFCCRYNNFPSFCSTTLCPSNYSRVACNICRCSSKVANCRAGKSMNIYVVYCSRRIASATTIISPHEYQIVGTSRNTGCQSLALPWWNLIQTMTFVQRNPSARIITCSIIIYRCSTVWSLTWSKYKRCRS